MIAYKAYRYSQAYAISWFYVICCPLSFHSGFPQCRESTVKIERTTNNVKLWNRIGLVIPFFIFNWITSITKKLNLPSSKSWSILPGFLHKNALYFDRCFHEYALYSIQKTLCMVSLMWNWFGGSIICFSLFQIGFDFRYIFVKKTSSQTFKVTWIL